MDDGPGFKAIARRLAFTLMCVLLMAMAAHMVVEPAKYSAAGGYQELRGGGGNAGGAISTVLRVSVDAIGTGPTAGLLALVSVVGLGLLWRGGAASAAACPHQD